MYETNVREGGAKMAHVSKYNRGSVGQLLKHYNRENYKNRNYGNDNIDKAKTHMNYNLAPERSISDYEFIKQRTKEVKCLKRKDVNIMADWIITIPKDFLENYPDKQEQFFKETYNFLEQKYGRENVISAFVHLDETTPHLHFAFVPVVKDKKKGHLKVSAKECITRSELKQFHPQLQEHLESRLKVPVNVLNEETREGNKAIEELKRKTATERLNEANNRAKEILTNANIELESLYERYELLNHEYKDLATAQMLLKDRVEQDPNLDTVLKEIEQQNYILELENYKAFIESKPNLRKEYQKWKGIGDNSHIR